MILQNQLDSTCMNHGNSWTLSYKHSPQQQKQPFVWLTFDIPPKRDQTRPTFACVALRHCTSSNRRSRIMTYLETDIIIYHLPALTSTAMFCFRKNNTITTFHLSHELQWITHTSCITIQEIEQIQIPPNNWATKKPSYILSIILVV